MADQDDDNVVSLTGRRKQSTPVALMTMPPPATQPDGPFTVTITDKDGSKIAEATFPDYRGELPADQPILGTVGTGPLIGNLLAGMLRTYLGAV